VTQPTYRESLASALVYGLKAAGVRFTSFLPDSSLYRIEELLVADADITTVQCTREDEGVAMAVGASMGGTRSVVLMEGTGLGYCGLILARARIQCTPLLVVFSHPRGGLGERLAHHSTSMLASHACLTGLDIPLVTPSTVEGAADTVAQAVETAYGQRCLVAVGIPTFIPSQREAER
jgi:sulfopyruvate decarboxylase TPP-binding subunit